MANKDTIITPEFRVSFPKVFKPERNQLNGKDEYSVVALFPKGADLKPMKKLAHEACIETFGKDESKWPKFKNNPFRMQEEKLKVIDGKEVLPPGHEAGAVFMNLRSRKQPGVVDERVQPILDESEFYAGCWAKALVTVYTYAQAGNSGFAFGLTHIQKVKDGESFGGRVAVEQAFAPVEMDDSDDESSDQSASSMFN